MSPRTSSIYIHAQQKRKSAVDVFVIMISEKWESRPEGGACDFYNAEIRAMLADIYGQSLAPIFVWPSSHPPYELTL
jgi:hypothetical protein